MKNILIIGNGAFGVAISQVLIENNNNVFMFSKNKESGEKLKLGSHDFFPNKKLLPPKDVFYDYDSVFRNHKIDIIVLCVPSNALNDIYQSIKKYITNDLIIVNTAKGLNHNNSSIWSELFTENNSSSSDKYCLLVGPSFASEIIEKNKTIVNIVCKDKLIAKELKRVFNNSYFKIIYFYNEYIASLTSSFKNSLALGLGLINHFTKSINTQSAFLIIGINEIQKILSCLCKSQETEILNFFGLGDIFLTCMSDESRNHKFGSLIGELGFKKASESLGSQTIEGYRTLKLINNFIKEHNLNCVLFKTLYEICYEDKDPNLFIDEIWNKFN